MKRIIGVILALILVTMPFTSSVTTSLRNNETYEIELYEMNGFRRKKHTAEISYEDLMEIKDKLDSFKGSTADEMEYCMELLTEQGVYTKVQWSSSLSNENYNVESSHIEKNGLMQSYSRINAEGRFIGKFSACFNIPIGFLFFALIVFMFSGVAEVTYQDAKNGQMKSETYSMLSLFIGTFIGLMLVIPFISPYAYFNGFVEDANGFGQIVNP